MVLKQFKLSSTANFFFIFYYFKINKMPPNNKVNNFFYFKVKLQQKLFSTAKTHLKPFQIHLKGLTNFVKKNSFCT